MINKQEYENIISLNINLVIIMIVKYKQKKIINLRNNHVTSRICNVIMIIKQRNRNLMTVDD